MGEGCHAFAMVLSLSVARPDAGGVGFGRRVRSRSVTLFARQLATLLAAGLPIVRSLDTLLLQERTPAFRVVLADLAARIRGGGSFSEALRRHPHVFDGLLVQMVKAGEAAGDLPTVLSRLADFRERSARVRDKVKAAMIYPVIVLSVAMTIVGLLMVFVIPQFQEIFEGMLRGQPLPLLTQKVIAVSEQVRHHWPWMVAGVVGGGILLHVASRTVHGKRLIDQVAWRIPVWGEVARRTTVARYTRTFGTLVRAGVPLLDAIRITQGVVGNGILRTLLDRQHDRVRDGDALSATLQSSRHFPPMAASMIAVGEETGQLPEMCDRIADAYEEEAETAVGALTALIEPMLIVILAVFVGTVVIALFLPIASIIQNLSAR